MDKKTTFGIACLLATLGTTIYAQGFRGDGVAVPAASADDEAYASRSGTSCTPIQNVILHYMITKQNYLLESTQDQATRDRIIITNCASLLTVMTPEQKQNELHNTMQIDRYRPGAGPWDQVRNAPSLVKELLALSKEQSAKIDAIMTASSDRFMAPITELTSRPGFKDLSRIEQNRQIQAVSEKLRAGRTSAQMYGLAVLRCKEEIRQSRLVLTPAQLKEFDQILSRFDALMRQVAPVPEPVAKTNS